MTKSPFRYFKTSREIMHLAVMMFVRFALSLRNVEELFHERGIDVCHESIRLRVDRFGPFFAAIIWKKRSRAMRRFTQWRWHLDEVHVKIAGETYYLWGAIDREGEVLEAYVTKTRDKAAVLKFLKKAMKRYGNPKAIVTDGLASYGAAMKDIGNHEKQQTGRYRNSRIESSHLSFRRRERAMLKFRRKRNLQKFAAMHASVHNHFSLDCQSSSRSVFKADRETALQEWRALITA